MTCAEGNEMLAEDRIMSHHAYIKDHSEFYFTYVVDAIAITDAPATFLDWMKQRRRWINGSVFSGHRLVRNSLEMLGCMGGANHSCCTNFGMSIFMFFFYINHFNE